MVFETREQSMAWMERGLQISLKRYALSMEDTMAAEAFGCDRNSRWDGRSTYSHSLCGDVSLHLTDEWCGSRGSYCVPVCWSSCPAKKGEINKQTKHSVNKYAHCSLLFGKVEVTWPLPCDLPLEHDQVCISSGRAYGLIVIKQQGICWMLVQ